MAKVVFELQETDSFERLSQKMESFDGYVGPIIDDVLHNKGAPLIRENIHNLLPASGRTWKGKKPAARDAQPFTQEFDAMQVTTKTIKNYHYLYFPDDGSTTYHHIGDQQFMYRGADKSAEKIIDECVDKITQEMEDLT